MLTRDMIGSPPRAWGQWFLVFFPIVCPRFTPTGVGTIAAYRRAWRRRAVHPHGRGDNLEGRKSSRLSVGSPPRAWGQYQVNPLRHRNTRFTPTGVGTIPTATPTRTPTAVHPHGRGDNRLFRVVTIYGDGSPPRAWGQ